MSIETVFAIKRVSVDDALREAERKVDKSAQRMDDSLNSRAGSGNAISQQIRQASKGMDAIAKSGSKAGSIMKNITNAFGALLNPVGLISAGIAGAIALINRYFRYLKEKAEQITAITESKAKLASEAFSSTLSENSKDRGYLKRLEEINRMEIIDNSTRIEAIRIIDRLNGRYGDMGLSIDRATGRIVNLTEATRRYNQLMRESEIEAARAASEAQANVVERKIGKVIGISKPGGITLDDIIEFFNPMSFAEKASLYSAQSLDPKLYQEQYESIVSRRAPMAVQKYVSLVGEKAAMRGKIWNDLQKWYTPPEDTEEMARVRAELAKVQEAMSNAMPGSAEMRTLERRRDVLIDTLEVMRQVEMLNNMRHDAFFDNDVMERSGKAYEAAVEQRNRLIRQYNLLSMGNVEGDIPKAKGNSESTSSLIESVKSLASARDKLATATEGLSKAHHDLAQSLKTTNDQYRVLKIKDSEYEDQVMRDREDINLLQSQYEELWKVRSRYRVGSNGEVDMEGTKSDYKAYLGLLDDAEQTMSRIDEAFAATMDDEEIRKLLWAKAETERVMSELRSRIASYNTDDRGRLIEYEDVERRLMELSRERMRIEERIAQTQTEQAEGRKKMMQMLVDEGNRRIGRMFSTMFGDLKETTNSLTARGGYLRGVNTLNGLQINRQILSTVIQANQYLQRINSNIYSMGRI